MEQHLVCEILYLILNETWPFKGQFHPNHKKHPPLMPCGISPSNFISYPYQVFIFDALIATNKIRMIFYIRVTAEVLAEDVPNLSK